MSIICPAVVPDKRAKGAPIRDPITPENVEGTMVDRSRPSHDRRGVMVSRVRARQR